jgi:hypothetical protein
MELTGVLASPDYSIDFAGMVPMSPYRGFRMKF